MVNPGGRAKAEDGPNVAYMSKLLRPVLADIQQLYTDLLYATPTWVNKFLAQEGVTVLLEVLKKKKERAKMAMRQTFSVSGQDIAICEESIRCLRHLLNFQTGVDAIFKRKDSATIIASCLGMDQGSLSRAIMELLAALCTVNDGAGHEYVLNGLSNAQRELGESVRFGTLVSMLEDEEHPIENQTACLTLINAIISTADEVQVRMRVRQDFINLGIGSILEKVKQRSEYSNELQSAVTVFEEEAVEDKAELSSTPVQHLDAGQLTRTLAAGVEGTAHQETFMQFLSQLLQLTSTSGASIWPKLLEYLLNMDQNTQKDVAIQKEMEGLHKEVNNLQTQNNKLRRELDELREAYSQRSSAAPSDVPPPPGAPGDGPPPPGGGPPPPPPPPGGGPPPPPPPPGGGPPPPPPPPGGGPPPPPPPPGGGPPPPPPPPGGGPPPPPGSGPPPPPPGPVLPPKKKIQPGTKMRQFNWNAVPVAKVPDTFWEKADESKKKIDTKALEELFSAKPAPPPTAAAKVGDKPKKVQIVLLDPKRSNNCSIMLSKFKFSYREIKEAILRLDDSILDLETTGYLAQYIPTKEEIDILNDYDGPKEELAKAEQYFLEIKDVPNLALRLNSWKFKLTFDEQYDEVKEDLSAFISACKEVKGSHQFHSVLEYVLGIGNYINGGTNRGGVYGFRLETLSRLSEMKSNDGKVTLMHFLTEQIRGTGDLASFPTTLSHCAHASKVSLPSLQGAIGSMKRDYDILNNSLPNIAATPGADKFKNVMNPFVEKVGKVVSTLESSLKQANEIYVEVCKFYGENDKTLAPEVLFGVVSNFTAQFQRLDRELTEKAAQRDKPKPERAAKGEASGEKGAQKTENVDDLVEGLKGGAVFKKRRTIRASRMIDAQKLKDIIPPEGQAAGEGASPWGQKILRPAPPQRQSTSPAAGAAPVTPAPLFPPLRETGGVKESSATPPPSTPPPATPPIASPPPVANAGAAGRGMPARPAVPGRAGLVTSSGKPTTPSRAPPATPPPSNPPPSNPPPSNPPPSSTSAAERSLSPTRGAPPPIPANASTLAAVPSRPISSVSPRGAVNPNQKVEVPHCRVLYDFVKEHDGELPLKRGDIVFLRKRLDALWLEGQIGGQVGAFPANYVDVIVDLPY